ncbi:LPS-assembly lipoprotein LptE [Lysobacter sp. A3-1-A15]|uniref:LPS-assembly lipoprotein LptE n=1 Tax=Novilysobacter viscosus TaxID=3098602 RepID=UPI002EDAB715
MTTPRIFRPLAPLLLALSLAACGFQLRDSLVLPPDLGPVKVRSVDRYSPLAETLARSLSRAGAVPAAADAADAAVLDLQAERWGDTPISVDSFGRAQEFSLRYAVVFELRRADGTALVPQQTIELARDYISVPTQSEGTEGEREILMRELQREMAAAVLRRIDAVTKGMPVGAVAPAGRVPALEADGVAPSMPAVDTMAPVRGDGTAPPEGEPEPEPTPAAGQPY